MRHVCQKTALITGLSGQDGPYLAAFLIAKGYRVFGVLRRTAQDMPERVAELLETGRLTVVCGDMGDAGSMFRIVAETRPDEIYNLAAQSDVKISFDCPEDTIDTDGTGVLRLLEAVRLLGLGERTRIFQASSSELFGQTDEPLQSETSRFAPRSPYAAAKLMAYWLVTTYRDGHGLHASNGIMFNHESPFRGADFVTRKISRAVAAIASGRQHGVQLGNLDACRDWSHARDMVAGMWLILQQPRAGDYVLASGTTTSVRQFATWAFAEIGIAIDWAGHGVLERGIDRRTGQTLVSVDPSLFRPTDVGRLAGDARKAERVLGWRTRVDVRALISEMVSADLNRIAQPVLAAAQ